MILKDENAAVLSMSTVDGESWLGTPIQDNKDYVTVDIHRAFIYAKILEEDKCLMKMIVNADPHIDYIPQKLINWALKNIIGVFLNMIVKKAKNLPEENKKLMEEKKEYYDELRRRISMLNQPDGNYSS